MVLYKFGIVTIIIKSVCAVQDGVAAENETSDVNTALTHHSNAVGENSSTSNHNQSTADHILYVVLTCSLFAIWTLASEGINTSGVRSALLSWNPSLLTVRPAFSSTKSVGRKKGLHTFVMQKFTLHVEKPVYGCECPQ